MLRRFRFRYLIFLSLLVFSLIALGSPVLSQAQSQLPYWTEARLLTLLVFGRFSQKLLVCFFMVGERLLQPFSNQSDQHIFCMNPGGL
jgi:hypothetical protein